MGVLTGVTGGIIRDVLTGEIPHIFRPTEPLYRVAALAGATGYIALQGLGCPTKIAALAGMALIASLRLAAMRWHVSPATPPARSVIAGPPTRLSL